MEFFNPNIGSEMSQLMISNQKKYVPTLKTDAENIILKSIPFHGDQLFEERARNIQWAYQDGDKAYDRLEGLETEFADWHAKLNLYMVCFNFFLELVKIFFGNRQLRLSKDYFQCYWKVDGREFRLKKILPCHAF